MLQFFRRRKPTDQADRLRDLVRDSGLAEQPPQTLPDDRPAMIVLAGSKGGVGVTTLALELSLALQAAGVRTVAVDANLRQANLAQLAGARQNSPFNIADIISGKANAVDALSTAPSGLPILPGAWAPDTHPQTTCEGGTQLVQQLGQLGQLADVVVVDAGSSHSPAAAPLWLAAQSVLLVTTSEELSLLGAYAAIKLARSEGENPKLQLLVNRITCQQQGQDVYDRIHDTCLQFLRSSLPLAGWVGEADAQAHTNVLARRLARTLSLETEKRPADELQFAPA